MAKARRHRPLPLLSSASTTPTSSAYPSAYPSEDERETAVQPKGPVFPFLSLPSELRNKIYGMIFDSALIPVLDLDPMIFRLLRQKRALALFLVSRQIYAETIHYFFSTYTFRIFPVHPGRFFKTKKPLLARLPAKYRATMTSLELRLGPGWNNPPRGWVVNKALGLEDCTSVRVLKIFVECDPSDSVFKGFRRSEGFYENFCRDLLEDVLNAMPSIQVVQFDTWSSVKRDGAMITTLETVVRKHPKVMGWVHGEAAKVNVSSPSGFINVQ